MKRYVLFLALYLLASLNISLFAVETFGNPSADNKILIATESTRYKNRLVDAIIEKLDDGNVYITKVDHKRKGLDGMDPREFSAVYITNSGAQAKVRPWVMDWLKQVAAYDDNILIHTTQITDWTPPVEVDSITSASSNGNIEALSDDVIRRLRDMF